MIFAYSFLIIFCAILSGNRSIRAARQDIFIFPEDSSRLEGFIIPYHYKIIITPDLFGHQVGDKEIFTFDGEVEIHLSTGFEGVNHIVLHSENLRINETMLIREDGSSIKIRNVGYNITASTMIVRLYQPMQQDETFVLKLKYSGLLQDGMKGFYRSYYKDSRGKVRWIAATHFQPFYARRAFPCFDEPRYKATFEIQIIRHRIFKSYSNNKLLTSISQAPDLVLDKFKITPPMPTYMVAFLVTDFSEQNDGVHDFSVIARREAIHDTDFAFDIGQEILNELNNYLGIRYNSLGIEKLHLAAIPDLPSAAMENWGLITFRETTLLYDEDITRKVFKETIATTIAHEMSHMWFGNLVTCETWSDIWLNEAFATYFQYFILKKIQSDLEVDNKFVLEQTHPALFRDSLGTAFPLSRTISNTAADIRSMFSIFTYQKGASLLRMISHLLGQDKFQRAIRSYLREYKFQSVTPYNLFNQLNKYWSAGTSDMTQILYDFTNQPGYPLVTVRLGSDGQELLISQERFMLNRLNEQNSGLKYTVPITYVTDKELNFSNTDAVLILKKESVNESYVLPVKAEFVIVNIQQVGYYRVNYDDVTWHRIQKFLHSPNFKEIHEINRAQIVDDLFNLARAGIVKYRFLFKTLEYLRHEDNYLPWLAAFTGFTELEKIFDADNSKILGKFILNITSEIYQTLGFEERKEEIWSNIYNRQKVLTWACRYGNKDCIEKAKLLYNDYYQRNLFVPINIRYSVYCTAIRYGGEEVFDFLWLMFQYETYTFEVNQMFSALCCTTSESSRKKYLKLIHSGNIRRQDKPRGIASIFLENVANLPLVLDFVISEYRVLADAFGGISEFAHFLETLITHITNEKQHIAIKSFLEERKNELAEYSQMIEDALKISKNYIKWRSVYSHEILDALKEINSARSSRHFESFGIGCFLSGSLILKYLIIF